MKAQRLAAAGRCKPESLHDGEPRLAKAAEVSRQYSGLASGSSMTVLPTSAHLDTIRRYAKSLGAKLIISFEWPDKTIEIG